MQTKVNERIEQTSFTISKSYINLGVMALSIGIWIISRSFGISELMQFVILASILMFFTKAK